MPAAPMAGPMPFVGQHPGIGNVAIETRREHQDHDAHLVTFAAEMLAGQPVAELVHDLRHAQHRGQQEGVVDVEELVELGQLGVEDVEFDRHQQNRRKAQQAAHKQRDGAEKPADKGIEPIQHPLRIEAFEADAEDVADGGEKLFADAFVAALAELPALAGQVGHDEPAAVQHPQELLQFLQGDLLRRKIGFKAVLDFVQAGLPVEHLQDGVFFLLEAEVVQAHRVLHHPVAAAEIVLPPRHQVGPPADGQHPGGTGQQAVAKGHHEGESERRMAKNGESVERAVNPRSARIVPHSGFHHFSWIVISAVWPGERIQNPPWRRF